MVGFILRWGLRARIFFSYLSLFLSCCIMERSEHGVLGFGFCISLARALLFLFWVCGQFISGRIFFGVVVGLSGSGWVGELSVPQCNHIQPHFLSSRADLSYISQLHTDNLSCRG
jgi:hypothetical protein